MLRQMWVIIDSKDLCRLSLQLTAWPTLLEWHANGSSGRQPAHGYKHYCFENMKKLLIPSPDLYWTMVSDDSRAIPEIGHYRNK